VQPQHSDSLRQRKHGTRLGSGIDGDAVPEDHPALKIDVASLCLGFATNCTSLIHIGNARQSIWN
jgi:hypothetical protein